MDIIDVVCIKIFYGRINSIKENTQLKSVISNNNMDSINNNKNKAVITSEKK